MFVFRVLNTVPYTNEAGAKDIIASLHSFLTSNLLVGLAVLVSWKQFGGKPIECMCPQEFTSAWVQVSYYQWMPFFLLFEAACFKFPCLIWKYFASQSGVRVGEILRLASDEHNAVPEVKKANINNLCVHLQGALRFHSRLKKHKVIPHKFMRFLNVKYSTHYVVMIYFVSKFFFLLNVGAQTRLLNYYLLPSGSANHGFDVWRNLWSGNETWQETGLFPRVTLCDFEVREMGSVIVFTVQCVLLLNIFTEKIFTLLWAWYLVLTALTTLNLISWIHFMFNETSKEHFVIKHLEMCETPFDKNDKLNREHVDRFIDVYLGLDGVFLLQLISAHADVVFATELIGALWRSHYVIEEQRKALKLMDQVLPLIRPESRQRMNGSEKLSPEGPRIKNPRKSVCGPSSATLKRTASFDDGELGDGRPFDSSDEDESCAASRRSSKK